MYISRKLRDALLQQPNSKTAIAKFSDDNGHEWYLTNIDNDNKLHAYIAGVGMKIIDSYDLRKSDMSQDHSFTPRSVGDIKFNVNLTYAMLIAYDIYTDFKSDKKELPIEEKMSYPLTPEQIAHVESISSEHLLNEFELLRIEEQSNEAAVAYETPQDEWIVPIGQCKEISDPEGTIRDKDVKHGQNALHEARIQEEELESEFDEMRERLEHEQELNESELETESKSQELSIDEIRLMEQWEQDREDARWELERDNEFDFCR